MVEMFLVEYLVKLNLLYLNIKLILAFKIFPLLHKVDGMFYIVHNTTFYAFIIRNVFVSWISKFTIL